MPAASWETLKPNGPGGKKARRRKQPLNYRTGRVRGWTTGPPITTQRSLTIRSCSGGSRGFSWATEVKEDAGNSLEVSGTNSEWSCADARAISKTVGRSLHPEPGEPALS